MAATFTQNQNPQLWNAQQMLMMQNFHPNGQFQQHPNFHPNGQFHMGINSGPSSAQSQQMQTQNSNPNDQVHMGINTGQPSGLDSEFGLNSKEVEEAVVDDPPKGSGEQDEYDDTEYGVPYKIIDRKIENKILSYLCYWLPSKSGKVYHDPHWAEKKEIEKVDGMKEMIAQFENERKVQAKMVPYHFIAPYFSKYLHLIPFCPCHLLLSQQEETEKQSSKGEYHVRFIPTILNFQNYSS